MKIKDVEKQVGISKANIRFYEEEGLIHHFGFSFRHVIRKIITGSIQKQM